MKDKLKKNYKLLLGIALIIIVLALVIFFIIRNITIKRNLENEFKDLANDYYEIFSKQNVFGVNEGDELTYSLQDLKELSYDVSNFQNNNCNLKESKATIKIAKDGYDINVKLDCK